MKKKLNDRVSFPEDKRHFAVQTVTGIIILKCEDVLLFEYIKSVRKWHVRLVDERLLALRMSVTSRDILSIIPGFVQINQDCIINLSHLLSIENKTLKCIFSLPYSGMINTNISPLYYKKIKDDLDVL
ncbi:MAG: hypothetical protein LBQ73_09915 [Tannerellaceae bacterium]|jgi:two-component system LytT family response regulator|nr:hypothetical protein [Tannerellaceae bacterium]